MTPKEHYRYYRADDTISPLSERLITEIMEFKPVSCFEMGCGTGKHLKKLLDLGVCPVGLDISRDNVSTAIFKHDLPCVILGDETYLRHLANCDIVFTCSVLDHIENVEGIISELKRIANKAVIIAEPFVHDPANYYWAHPYQSMFDFSKTDFTWRGEDGHPYNIYIWRKQQDGFDPIAELDTLTIRTV